MPPIHAPRSAEQPLGETRFYRRLPIEPPVAVYASGQNLVIRELSDAPFGGSLERRYPRAFLEPVRRRWSGQTVTAREVADAIRLRVVPLEMKGIQVPLAYAARDILILLAATGSAQVDCAAAEPHFTIGARAE